MKHRWAWRLIPALLEGTLAAPVEAAARAHVEKCPRCRRELDELAAVEALLARLPASLVPVEPTAGAHARLTGLARWAPLRDPPLAWRESGLPAIGAVAAAAVFSLLVSTADYVPAPHGRFDAAITLAAVVPEARFIPTGPR
jgi:anti-sigma factor RsiW